jgi:hypothetical protein
MLFEYNGLSTPRQLTNRMLPGRVPIPSSELVGVARYWHGLAGVARGSMARESFVHGWSGLRGLEPATPCHEAMKEAMKP